MLSARRLAGAGQRLRPPLRTVSHPRSHTLTLPRALSHTHSPPSSCSVYLLQLSRDPGEAQHRACATQSPPPPRTSQPAATLRRRRPAVSRMASWVPLPLARGQRLLPAAPTNMLVGEPRTAATNPLCRSPDPQPVGGKARLSPGHRGSRSFSLWKSSWSVGPPRPVALSYSDAPPTLHPRKMLPQVASVTYLTLALLPRVPCGLPRGAPELQDPQARAPGFPRARLSILVPPLGGCTFFTLVFRA